MIFRKEWFQKSLAIAAAAAGIVTSAWAMPEFSWNGQGRGFFRHRGNPNAPQMLDMNFDMRFGDMPLASRVPDNKLPYGDTYWPGNMAGIANRWNSRPWRDPYLYQSALRYRNGMPNLSTIVDEDERAVVEQLFKLSPAERESIANEALTLKKYHLYSREEIIAMSRNNPKLLETLSPTEKYDIARGDYNYKFTHKILDWKEVGPGVAYWQGICHGWAPASVNHAEPLPNNVRNPDGVVVPFGSADVKAMLDYLYATESMNVRQMGVRCYTDLKKNPGSTDSSCEDTNAGAFHIVMANYIGLRHQAFVADISRGVEVWNNPIYSYESKIVEQTGPIGKHVDSTGRRIDASAEGTVRRVHLHTTALTPSDDQRLPPQWDAVTLGTPATGWKRVEMTVPESEGALDPAPYKDAFRYEKLHYDYWLDLGVDGSILGGEWVPQYEDEDGNLSEDPRKGKLVVEDRPDYVWMKNQMAFTGDYETLNRIYKPAYNADGSRNAPAPTETNVPVAGQ